MKPLLALLLPALLCLSNGVYAQCSFTSQQDDYFLLNHPDVTDPVGNSLSDVPGSGSINYNSTSEEIFMNGVFDLTSIGNGLGSFMIWSDEDDANAPLSMLQVGDRTIDIVVAEQNTGKTGQILMEHDNIRVSAGDAAVGSSFIDFTVDNLHLELYDDNYGQSTMADLTSANGFQVRSVRNGTGTQAFGVINHALTNLFTVKDDGDVAIGTTPSSGYILTINGSALASGGTWVNSDARYKTGVQPISNALDKVLAMTGVTYKYRSEEFEDWKFSDRQQIGFIAQELEKVVPEAVKTDDKGYKAVNYANLTALLSQAIKEDHAELEEVKATIDEQLQAKDLEIENLQKQIDELKALVTNTTSTNTQQVDIKGVGAASYLEQNTPNPFKGQTSIKYFVNGKDANAVMVITDMSGRAIKSIKLATGTGNVDLNFSDFPSGTLIYSLQVNGEVISSKQMIRE